jgi:phage-related protein
VEKNFNTAAKDQANTLAGLENSFDDLKNVVLRTALEPVFKALQPYLVQFAELLQSPALLASVKGIGEALGRGFGTALSVVSSFFSILGNNISAGRSPLDALRMALLNIVPPELIPIVNGVINAIQTVIATVIGLVAQTQVAAAGGAGGIMDMLGISPEMQATIVAIVASVQSILQQLVGYVQANLPAMKAVATDVFNGIGWLVQNVLAPWFTFLVTKLGEVVSWVSDKLPLLLNVISSFANTVMSLFSVAWPYIQQVALAALQSLQAGVSFVLTLIQGIITAALQALNGDWEGAWNTLKTTAETLWQEILTFMRGFPKAMLDIGKKIIDGLIEGVKSKAAQFKEALLSILPPAIRAVLAQMGIASPSKVTMRIGNQIMDGLVLPFEKRSAELLDAMQGVFAPMTQAPALPGLMPAAAAAGGGETKIVINMGGVTMANDMDAYTQAYRIAKRVKDGI